MSAYKLPEPGDLPPGDNDWRTVRSREWVGLTDKELLQLFAEMDINAHAYEDDSLDFARAVEAALKEKNT